MEMLEAVDEDLMCLKNSSVKNFLINWRKIEEQLFDQAKQTLNSGAELKIIEAFEYARDNYDSFKQTRNLLILLARLVSSNGNKRTRKDENVTAVQKILFSLLQQFPEGTSPKEATEIANTGGMGTIGLLVIGRGRFHVKCDDISFPLRVKLLEEAIGCLVAYLYCLHSKHPSETKFVYSFLEWLFGFDASVQSRAVTMLIQRLSF